MADLFTNVVLVILAISIAVGPLGSFVVWQRLSYFGDTVSHSAVLGVTIAMIMKVNYIFGILVVAFVPSLILLNLRNCYTKDMMFSIVSNSSTAVALVLFSIIAPYTSIMSLLFGDILTVDSSDILLTYFLACVIVVVTVTQWKNLLLITISRNLAIVANINVKLLQLTFMTLLSIFIALSINVVGALLVTSLLVVPTATARVLTHKPVSMVVISSIICFIASLGGLLISFQFDSPTGPSIIVASTAVLILSNIYSYIRVNVLKV